MVLHAVFGKLLSDEGLWFAGKPASEDAIADLIRAFAFDLPPAYLDFLRLSNGGLGELGIDPLILCLWPAEEVVALNDGYEMAEYLPNFLAFADNSSTEVLAFDVEHWKIYSFLKTDLFEDEALFVADSFLALLEHVVPWKDRTDVLRALGERLRKRHS